MVIPKPDEKKKKLTTYDIARLAGVTQPVVSALINNSGKNGVGKEKRDKILAIIKEHHFIPNQIARNLSKQETKIINVLIPSARFLADKENSEFLVGLQEYLDEHEYSISIATLGRDYLDQKPLDRGLIGDARIIFYWGNNTAIERVSKEDKPLLVCFGEYPDLGISNLVYDHYQAGYALVQHLAQLGHKDILYFDPVFPSIQYEATYHGAAAAVKDYEIINFSRDDSLKIKDFSQTEFNHFRSGYEVYSAALNKCTFKPSGIICTQKDAGLGMINAAKDAGLTIPGDLSIAGIGGSSSESLVKETLTNVEIDGVAAGRKGGQLILELLANENSIIREKVAFTMRAGTTTTVASNV